MPETSYFWGGTTTGDGALAPYSDDEFSDVWRIQNQSGRGSQGVLFSFDYTNPLAVTNPSGTTIRVAAGYAVVDGKLYRNTANVDNSITAPGAGTNYYTVVLRKSWSAQTVRIALLGPDTGSYPTVTQSDGTTWEVLLAQVSITSGGAITVTDARSLVANPGSGVHRLSRQYVSTRAGTITFSSISPLYSALVLHIMARGYSAIAPTSIEVQMRFNGDTGNNYDNVNLFGDGGGTVTALGNRASDRIQAAAVAANGSAANVADAVRIEIFQYAETTFQKRIISQYGTKLGTGSDASLRTAIRNGWWRDTDAINEIELAAFDGSNPCDFEVGSTAILYGVI